MNKDKLLAFIERLKSPEALLTYVVIMCGSVLLLIVSFYLGPAVTKNVMLQSNLNQLEAQKALIDLQPVPAQASSSAISDLLEQVPVDEQFAGFLLWLKQTEEQTGVIIESVNRGSGEQAFDPLLSETAGQAASSAATSQQQLEGTLQHPVTVSVVGQYAQIHLLLQKLYESKRIVHVTDWSFSSSASAAGEQTAVQEEPVLQAEIRLRIYSAPSYADQFDTMPLPIVPSGAHRKSPILSEEQFIRALEGSVPEQSERGGGE